MKKNINLSTKRSASRSNLKLKTKNTRFWTRKSTGVIVLATIAIGVGALIRSFAMYATNRPSSVTHIDSVSSQPGNGQLSAFIDRYVTFVGARSSDGNVSVNKITCTPTSCISDWTKLGPSLRNVNVSFTQSRSSVILGGVGTDNKYYFSTKSCLELSCPWSAFKSAGGSMPSAQSVLTQHYQNRADCASVSGIGNDRKIYTRDVCVNMSGARDWSLSPGAANVNIRGIYKDDTGVGNPYVYAVNNNNVVTAWHVPSSADQLLTLTNGAFLASSDHPLTALENCNGCGGQLGVGTDTQVYTNTNSSNNWGLYYGSGKVGYITNIYRTAQLSQSSITGSGSVLVARGADGAPRLIKGTSTAPTIENLGGNCRQISVQLTVISCIGSDSYVYIRTLGLVNWQLL